MKAHAVNGTFSVKSLVTRFASVLIITLLVSGGMLSVKVYADTLGTFTQYSASAISRPFDITQGLDGNLWGTDSVNSQIIKSYNLRGNDLL